MKVHGLILARGGSKGIPKKNIKKLNGVPLLVYNVKAAIASGVFEKVIVSSDDEEILEVAKRAGAIAFERDPKTASDTASSEAGIEDYISRSDCEVLCLIQCTSPLTTAEDFRKGLELFTTKKADSLVTVVRSHRFLWQVEKGEASAKNYEPAKRPRRQDWNGELIENGAFYFFTVSAFRSSGSRLSGHIVALEMAEETLVEIDSLTDWKIVEFLAAEKFKDLPLTWGFS